MSELINWEKTLKPFFDSNLRIIGEIPISSADLDELAEIIRAHLQIGPFTQATRRIVDKYPFTFMTLLAHFAGANDQAGYWEALQEKVGATQHLQISGWHREFLKLAKANNLKTFNQSDTPIYYVATIRFHGGIPAYSLPDFFERMVKPAVMDPQLKEVPLRQALGYLVENANVDKPVKDFINNSGEMGLAWFESCCRLVKHAEQNYGEILPRSAVPDLPGNIHTYFEQYSEIQSDKVFRWKKPYLELNPYTEEAAVSLRLPSQVVPLSLAETGMVWVVTLSELDSSITIPCEILRQGQDFISRESFFPIPHPTTSVTVSLASGQAGGNQIRRWSLPLFQDHAGTPLLAFKENFRQMPHIQTLPAEDLFLLTPAGSDLVTEGQTQREGPIRYSSPGWVDWQSEHLSLKKATSLLLHKNGQPLGNVIPISWVSMTPELFGGSLFEFQENLEQPLYLSAPPDLLIPRAINASNSQALAGWKLSVAAIGHAAPNINKLYDMRDWSEFCLFEPDQVLFPLSSIFGEAAAGSYEVKVFNPKGEKSEFQIRLWPHLELKNYTREFPDTDDAKRPIKFEIHLAEGTWFSDQSSPMMAKITAQNQVFGVEAPHDARRIALMLSMADPEGGTVQVPCSIPIVRLRWGLAEALNPGEMKLEQNGIHISAERFHQYESSALHVEMHGLAAMIGRISCQLVETDAEDNVFQEASFLRTGFSRDQLRVSLKQFADTVRASNTQVQFQLVYQKDTNSLPIRYTLLEVSPEMLVSDAKLEQISDLGWKLTWREDLPLKGRRVMLKSNWQPWQHVIEAKIPDSNRGEFQFEDISLPISSYSVYFYVRRRWEPAPSVPPRDSVRTVIELQSPRERLSELNLEDSNPNRKFRNSIEAGCIYDSLGDVIKRDEALSKAALPLINLTDIVALVRSVHWMESKMENSSIFSFFRKYMFHHMLVESILTKYPKDDPNLISYLRMVRLTETDSEASRLYAKTAYLLLDHVDDPLVVATCLRSLIARQDEDVISHIVKMIQESRLSANDAAEILTYKQEVARWALQALTENEDDRFSDLLLTKVLVVYLPKVPNGQVDWLQRTLKKAILAENSSEAILMYLDHLSESEDKDLFPILLKIKEIERIDDEAFYHYLKRNPEESLSQLKNPELANLSTWIEKLEREFPQAAGIISLGDCLSTPFGEASIVSIHALDGAPLNSVKKTDSQFILTMNAGTGREKVDFYMDFDKHLYYLFDKGNFFRCAKCEKFSHPVQNVVLKHHQSMHRYEPFGFQIVRGMAAFDPSDIKITNEKNTRE